MSSIPAPGSGAAAPQVDAQPAGLFAFFGSGPAGPGAPPPPAGGTEEENSGLMGYLNPFAATPANEEDWTCGLTRIQRLQVFMLLLLVSAAFFLLAFFMLPMVILFPAKFAMSFTIASILFMSAFAVLNGVRPTLSNLLHQDRVYFTGAYVGSLLLTLYATFFASSYLLILLSAGTQVVALMWYGATYIPGGTQGMRMLSGVCWAMAQSICGGLGRMASGSGGSGGGAAGGAGGGPMAV